MRWFRWRGIDVHGVVHHGSMVATNSADVKRRLFQQGIAFLQVRIDWVKEFFYKIRVRTSRNDSLILFFHHCSSLLTGGVQLVHVLETIANIMTDATMREQVEEVKKRVECGEAFSQALSACMNVEQSLVQMVAAGEEAGQLASVLTMIHEYLEHKASFAKKVKSAALLPVITLSFALSILVGLLLFIVPQFELFFSALDKPLPDQTKSLIAFSEWLRQPYTMTFLLTSCLIGILILRKIKMIRAVQNMLELIQLRSGPIGTLIITIESARFFTILALLSQAGLPLERSLRAAGSVVRRQMVRATYEQCAQKVAHGFSLSHGLSQMGMCAPPSYIVRLIQVGEKAGDLNNMLGKAAKRLTEGASSSITTLTKLVPPLLLIVVALVIAGMLWSVYLPLFSGIYGG